MDHSKHKTQSSTDPIPNNFFERIQTEGWTHIKTVVDVVSCPILILDTELRVLAANESFYRKFNVEPDVTEKHFVYELGDGQWDILSLRRHLEDILTVNKHFKGFEVECEFPTIGRRIMILNARQIHFKNDDTFQPIILLAIEDVTDIMSIAQSIAEDANGFNSKIMERTESLEIHIDQLQKEIDTLKIHTKGS